MRPFRREESFANRTTQILRDSGGVQLSGHLQAVEALHPADGFGQHLSRLHGGHLSAGLRQVAEVTQPCLQKRERPVEVSQARGEKC